jgi:predicted secreted protein
MDERFQSVLLAVLVIIFWAVLFPVINDATGTAATRHFNATGLNEAAWSTPLLDLVLP